jgi:hypothetical protein
VFKRVLDELIRPAVAHSSLGLRVVRADDIHRPGSFIRDVVEYLAGAHTVIVDLTGQNANVFYELGVRHALSPRTILIARSADDIPSDLREYRTLIYADNADGDAVFRENLRKYLDEIERTPDEPDNPVLSWLKPPVIPDDLRQTFTARLANAGGTQPELLRLIQMQTYAPGSTISQSEIEDSFKKGGAEIYYRLEQLRLLGFIVKEVTESKEFAYRLTYEYRRELGLPEAAAQLRLLSARGTTLRFGDSADAPPAHFYYVRARNLTTRPQGIRIVITRIRTFAVDDTILDDYRTRMQIKWRSRPDRCVARTVEGRGEAVANLGFIVKDHGFFQLDICADPWPEGFPAPIDARKRMHIDLVAEINGADESAEAAIEVAWDGVWRDDAGEMEKHLTVMEIPGAS